MSVAAGWISQNWIFSDRPEDSGRYWIADDWIWGPAGALNPNTRYWIKDGFIWGPLGAENLDTGYSIHDGWIWGPEASFPFTRPLLHGSPLPRPVLTEATIPELPNHYRGKVRDNYDLPDGRRIIIANDRLSAFDLILAAIPYKGQVLTQTARYWFEATADICPNHVLAYPDPNVVIGRRLDILPVEIVVRGYLAGTTSTSILTRYRKGERQMYGVAFPDGMRDNQALDHPIITPTSKAADGEHDAPLTPAEILDQGLLSPEQWETVSRHALALFARGQALAAERGLILADTKYEFGTDVDGRIVLADEIHTPDSSRYWIASSYPARFAAGERPESFDKDFVRSWVAERCDPYRDPIPEIPAEVVTRTSDVYVAAFETITGQRFEPPAAGTQLLERIRRNLAAYF